MERKRYLEMCREVATLDSGIERIKLEVPDHLRVVYDGKEFYPVKYELEFQKDGTVIHTAVIHELGTNAWHYVPLDKVDTKEQK